MGICTSSLDDDVDETKAPESVEQTDDGASEELLRPLFLTARDARFCRPRWHHEQLRVSVTSDDSQYTSMSVPSLRSVPSLPGMQAAMPLTLTQQQQKQQQQKQQQQHPSGRMRRPSPAPVRLSSPLLRTHVAFPVTPVTRFTPVANVTTSIDQTDQTVDQTVDQSDQRVSRTPSLSVSATGVPDTAVSTPTVCARDQVSRSQTPDLRAEGADVRAGGSLAGSSAASSVASLEEREQSTLKQLSQIAESLGLYKNGTREEVYAALRELVRRDELPAIPDPDTMTADQHELLHMDLQLELQNRLCQVQQQAARQARAFRNFTHNTRNRRSYSIYDVPHEEELRWRFDHPLPSRERMQEHAKELLIRTWGSECVRDNEEQLRQRKVQELVIMGPGSSGKSTLVKQLSLLSGIQFRSSHRQSMGQQIPLAVVDAMLTLCNFNQVMRRDFIDAQYFAVSPETIAVVERFRAEAESYLHGGEEELPPTVARLLKRVWRDRGFKATFRNRMRMRSNQIGDTMDYYFDKIESLAVRDWRPSDEDILRFRYRTSGLMAQYLLDPVTRALFHIIDFGGQRAERRKWTRAFHAGVEISAVVFVAALSGYDQMLFEDSNAVRFVEALELWAELCRSALFRDKPLILVLNKRDLFEDKQRRVALSSIFPDFDGRPGDYDHALDFLRNKFLARAHDRADSVRVHVVCSLDSADVRTVFDSIRDAALANVEDDVERRGPSSARPPMTERWLRGPARALPKKRIKRIKVKSRSKHKRQRRRRARKQRSPYQPPRDTGRSYPSMGGSRADQLADDDDDLQHHHHGITDNAITDNANTGLSQLVAEHEAHKEHRRRAYRRETRRRVKLVFGTDQTRQQQQQQQQEIMNFEQ